MIEIYTYFGRVIRTFEVSNRLHVDVIEDAREWANKNVSHEWWLRIK